MLRSIFLLVKGCAVCLCKGCAALIYIYISIKPSLRIQNWVPFGPIWINGSPLGPFGLTLGPSELASGPVAHFGPMCPLWALGPPFGPRANLGPFGFICAHLGPFCTYVYIYIYLLFFLPFLFNFTIIGLPHKIKWVSL